MLDSITCDTPISSLISISKVNPILKELENISESYEDRITSVIHSEEANGGLSGEAITATTSNGGNDAILTVAADEYLKESVKLVEAVNEIKDATLVFLRHQRKMEINKLIEKIQEKLDELSSRKYDLLGTLGGLDPSKDSSYYSVLHRLNITNDLIDRYKARKASVEGLE